MMTGLTFGYVEGSILVMAIFVFLARLETGLHLVKLIVISAATTCGFGRNFARIE